MNRAIFFTLFVFSLPAISIASFNDWLIVFLIVQTVWISVVAKELLFNNKVDTTFKTSLLKLYRFGIRLLGLDILITILSMLFIFRVLLAIFYLPIGILTAIVLPCSLISGYYIVYKYISTLNLSPVQRICYIISSLIYPIGVFTFSYLINKNEISE